MSSGFISSLANPPCRFQALLLGIISVPAAAGQALRHCPCSRFLSFMLVFRGLITCTRICLVSFPFILHQTVPSPSSCSRPTWQCPDSCCPSGWFPLLCANPNTVISLSPIHYLTNPAPWGTLLDFKFPDHLILH